MSGVTYNVCPHCGCTVPIDNNNKYRVCLSCGFPVSNDGWYGWRNQTENSAREGCLTVLLILIWTFILGVNLISCIV